MASTPYSAVTPYGAQAFEGLVGRENAQTMQNQQLGAQQQMQSQGIQAQQQMQDQRLQVGQQMQTQELQAKMQAQQAGQSHDLEMQRRAHEQETREHEAYQKWMEHKDGILRQQQLEDARVVAEARAARSRGDSAKLGELTRRRADTQKRMGATLAQIAQAQAALGATGQQLAEIMGQVDDSLVEKSRIHAKDIETGSLIGKDALGVFRKLSMEADEKVAGMARNWYGGKSGGFDDLTTRVLSDELAGFSLLTPDMTGWSSANMEDSMSPFGGIARGALDMLGMGGLPGATDGTATASGLAFKQQDVESIRSAARTRIVEGMVDSLARYVKGIDKDKARKAIEGMMEVDPNGMGDGAVVAQRLAEAGLSPTTVAHAFQNIHEQVTDTGPDSLRDKLRAKLIAERQRSGFQESAGSKALAAQALLLEQLAGLSGNAASALGSMFGTEAYDEASRLLRQAVQGRDVMDRFGQLAGSVGVDSYDLDRFKGLWGKRKSLQDEVEGSTRQRGEIENELANMGADIDVANLEGDEAEAEALRKGLEGLIR